MLYVSFRAHEARSGGVSLLPQEQYAFSREPNLA